MANAVHWLTPETNIDDNDVLSWKSVSPDGSLYGGQTFDSTGIIRKADLTEPDFTDLSVGLGEGTFAIVPYQFNSCNDCAVANDTSQSYGWRLDRLADSPPVYNGTWSLYVQDFYEFESGSIDSWVVRFHQGMSVVSFSGGSITINDFQVADPWPSTVVVTGITGTVDKVTVRINGFTHGYPLDVGIAITSPNGRLSRLMGGAGGDVPVTDFNFTFDDTAVEPPPEGTVLVNNSTYLPWVYMGTVAFDPPLPNNNYSGFSPLSTFNETQTNQWGITRLSSISGYEGYFGGAFQISGDGKKIVGYTSSLDNSGARKPGISHWVPERRALVWDKGLSALSAYPIDLGTPPQSAYMFPQATAISKDGLVIGGNVLPTDGTFTVDGEYQPDAPDTRRAWLWNEADGMSLLSDVLSAAGVNPTILTTYTFLDVFHISGNGKQLLVGASVQPGYSTEPRVVYITIP